MKKGVENSFGPGDVVYCVSGEREKPIVVEKATVDSKLKGSDSARLPYYDLIVWDHVDKEPAGEGVTITKVPWELLTHQDVEDLLNKGPLDTQRDIDALVDHPMANHNLAGTIGGAIINRMVDTPQRLIEAHDRTIAGQ